MHCTHCRMECCRKTSKTIFHSDLKIASVDVIRYVADPVVSFQIILILTNIIVKVCSYFLF